MSAAKSLIKTPKYKFSKNICIIAGGPHMDLVGSKIISNIKQQEPDAKFFGVGGQLMMDQGLQSYADVNSFLNKPLYPYKNFKHKHIERPVHPVYGFNHHANRSVRNQIDKTSFFEDILKVKPDAFLCLQNDFFMNRLYNFLNDLYDKNNLVKPPVFHYDRTHINQRQEFTDWLDHQFSVNPLQPVNYGYYTFPSTVVGHEGVGRAWQYIYNTNPKFAKLTSDNHIYLSPEHNKNIIEKLVADERINFRAQAGIHEGQSVIFFAPGDCQKDLDYSKKAIAKGLPEFLNRPENQNIDKSHFVLMVSQPETSFANQIEQQISALNLPISVKFTTQKYGAIAASDCGIVYNGEMVSECAALQLPVIILENMPYAQAHFMQLYNHWNNELNIATKGEQQQELVTTGATPYRISEELQVMQDPRQRYYLAGKLQNTLYSMVPQAHTVEGNEIQVENQQFVKHDFTYNTITNKILKAANVYSKSDKNIPHYKINAFRSELLSNAI